MKKTISAIVATAVLAFGFASCENIANVYKPVGGAYSAVYFPGGFTGASGWFNEAGADDAAKLAANEAATKATKVTTEAGFVSTWKFTTTLTGTKLTDTNREFKWNNVAKWGGERGATAVTLGTGIIDGGGADRNMKIDATVVPNGDNAIIKLNQGTFDEATLVYNKDTVSASIAP